MIIKREFIIVLFALSNFVMPALSQNIHESVKSGDFEKVKVLFEKSPTAVNAKDDRSCTPLHVAAEGGYKEIAEFLLANGAESDAREINSNTPLQYAAMNGKVELAELLLANGADINAQNKDQFASLHLAAWNKHKSIIKSLVEIRSSD